MCQTNALEPYESRLQRASARCGNFCASVRSPAIVFVVKFRSGPSSPTSRVFERRVVIEVDGSAHDSPERRERDATRDLWIVAQRIRVLRLEDGEVLEYPEMALERIRKFLGVSE